jgi:hypothetical protein
MTIIRNLGRKNMEIICKSAGHAYTAFTKMTKGSFVSGKQFLKIERDIKEVLGLECK